MPDVVSVVKTVVSKITPNAVQYPIQQVYKRIQNIQQGRKLHSSWVRLMGSLMGGGLTSGLVPLIPTVKSTLLVVVQNNISNTTFANVAVYGGLFIAGTFFFDTTLKHGYRAYLHHKYKVTNLEYVALTTPESEGLEKRWGVSYRLANELFTYLRDKILRTKSKLEKTKDNGKINAQKETITSTKLALQALKSAGISEEADLFPVAEYLSAQAKKLQIRITEREKILARRHVPQKGSFGRAMSFLKHLNDHHVPTDEKKNAPLNKNRLYTQVEENLARKREELVKVNRMLAELEGEEMKEVAVQQPADAPVAAAAAAAPRPGSIG